MSIEGNLIEIKEPKGGKTKPPFSAAPNVIEKRLVREREVNDREARWCRP